MIKYHFVTGEMKLKSEIESMTEEFIQKSSILLVSVETWHFYVGIAVKNRFVD